MAWQIASSTYEAGGTITVSNVNQSIGGTYSSTTCTQPGLKANGNGSVSTFTTLNWVGGGSPEDAVGSFIFFDTTSRGGYHFKVKDNAGGTLYVGQRRFKDEDFTAIDSGALTGNTATTITVEMSVSGKLSNAMYGLPAGEESGDC